MTPINHQLIYKVSAFNLYIYSCQQFKIAFLCYYDSRLHILSSTVYTSAVIILGKPLTRVTTGQLFDEYGLDDNTRAFTGHAMALHTDDDYLQKVGGGID